MITQIDNLKMPPSLESVAELFNRDTQRRTASGRLITKLDTTEKWRVTVSYDTNALSRELQASFYSKCMEMRQSAKHITFVSPYDGELQTITAKCVSRATPSAFNLYARRPEYYIKVGAVFEEV